MTTDTRSAFEIAVAALTELGQLVDEKCPGCQRPVPFCIMPCCGQKAREALAAMRAAPGLASDPRLRELLGAFLADCGPTLVHRVERALEAIDAYQREKAGL